MRFEHIPHAVSVDPTAALGDARTIHLRQGPVRIYERGAGRPLVFVHGLFVNAAAWRKVVPLLADSYRCITADWPFGGHHTPMTPDADLTPTGIADTIADVIDQLDLHDATLIGNDGGGMLSQLVITRRPHRFGRLILTPCDAYENFPPPQFDYLCRISRVPGIEHLAGRALRIPAVRTRCARSSIGFAALTNSPIDTEVLDHYLHGVTHDTGVLRDSIELLRAVDNRYTLDAAARFPTIDLPVLIAWAPDDQVFPFRHAEQLAADFPNSQLAEIPNSRTWVAEDQPERLAHLIREFIDPAREMGQG
ncbi:alpha/beta fold hydrolase [Nocardia sp. NPDC058518]|uniref:alpha/beta fold hydrolase n=1 Tax=Nocardia sp. NPDC058518 TaxID=3346534 RepID=UPI00364A5E42